MAFLGIGGPSKAEQAAALARAHGAKQVGTHLDALEGQLGETDRLLQGLEHGTANPVAKQHVESFVTASIAELDAAAKVEHAPAEALDAINHAREAAIRVQGRVAELAPASRSSTGWYADTAGVDEGLATAIERAKLDQVPTLGILLNARDLSASLARGTAQADTLVQLRRELASVDNSNAYYVRVGAYNALAATEEMPLAHPGVEIFSADTASAREGIGSVKQILEVAKKALPEPTA